jgi:hypothetical protein
MTLHIVLNERNQEVAAYTDKQQATLIANELEAASQERYRVKELVCVTQPEDNSKGAAS